MPLLKPYKMKKGAIKQVFTKNLMFLFMGRAVSKFKEEFIMEERNKNKFITYAITYEQAETICKFKNKDINTLTDEQICLLLDEVIDMLDAVIDILE